MRLPLVMVCGLAALAALTACAGTSRNPTVARWGPAGDASPTTVAASPVPLPAAPTTTARASATPAGPVVPRGVTAAIAVFDRRTGAFTERRNVTMRFRSASLVKLLIALDYLWDRGPAYTVPAAERSRLDAEAARKAPEERERLEKAEAEARARQLAEQEARAAAARECRRLEQERLDGRAMLADFVAKYGKVDEFKGIAGQISAFLDKARKVKPCPPA